MGQGPCGLTPRLQLKDEHMVFIYTSALSFTDTKTKVQRLELKQSKWLLPSSPLVPESETQEQLSHGKRGKKESSSKHS